MPEHEKSCEARDIVERLTNTCLSTPEPAWKKTIPKINGGSTEVRTAPPPGVDPLYKGKWKPRLFFDTDFISNKRIADPYQLFNQIVHPVPCTYHATAV